MDILQKHTAQFFGIVKYDIKRTVNYSAQRKSSMTLLDRVLYRQNDGIPIKTHQKE